MFTQAFVALNDLARTVSPDTALEAGRILQQTCLRLTEGQYLDISYETRADLGLVDYWPMIGGKTSALLACCAELGALAGGAGVERRAEFHEFGFALGLAFQVLDDWLGTWGDAAMTGKSTDSDLVSGKKSLPVLFALGKNGAFARRWAQAPIQPRDVPEVVQLLEAEGAQEFTLAEAERLTGRALDALQRAAPLQADSLRELTGVLLTRKH
jgi:geranylgeranyl diphosphate synthase type I